MAASLTPAPIIVTALLGPADQAFADALRRAHYPAARNHVPAHLTLFHQLPPASGPELATRLRAAVAGRAPPRARIAGVMRLEAGVALSVHSAELAAIRDELADGLAGLLGAQDRAGWQPHITIQNGVTARAAKALFTALSADVTARPLHIAGLASWAWRGGPWQAIGSYRFTGRG